MWQGQSAAARSNTQLKIHHWPGNFSRLAHGRTYPNDQLHLTNGPLDKPLHAASGILRLEGGDSSSLWRSQCEDAGVTQQARNAEIRCKLYRCVGSSALLKSGRSEYELNRVIPLTGIASNHRHNRSNSSCTPVVKVSPLESRWQSEPLSSSKTLMWP